MPLYEYQCTACGKRTEVLQRFADAPITTCPTCGGEVKKLISSPAFQFKGSGWYATDYAAKKGGSDGAPKADAKSDDKSAEKSDSSSSSAATASSTETPKTKEPAAKAAAD
ncbi:MAG TPA: FmdB family zinc ribbon protein [Thermoanaerobaculia bacterium]